MGTCAPKDLIFGGNATCGLGYESRSLVCGADSCALVFCCNWQSRWTLKTSTPTLKSWHFSWEMCGNFNRDPYISAEGQQWFFQNTLIFVDDQYNESCVWNIQTNCARQRERAWKAENIEKHILFHFKSWSMVNILEQAKGDEAKYLKKLFCLFFIQILVERDGKSKTFLIADIF